MGDRAWVLGGQQHPQKEQRHTTGGQEPCDGRSGKKRGERWAPGRRWLQNGPQNECQPHSGLKPNAPTPGFTGPGPGRRLHQAALPALSPGRHPPALPSWATGAEEAETKKGEEGDPRMGGSLFFPAPSGRRVGTGRDRRDSGRQKETPGQGHSEKPEEPHTPRSRDPEREREGVLRQGKRHIKRRRQVGKLSEGEISARKDLVERGAEMPGGGGPGVGS